MVVRKSSQLTIFPLGPPNVSSLLPILLELLCMTESMRPATVNTPPMIAQDLSVSLVLFANEDPLTMSGSGRMIAASRCVSLSWVRSHSCISAWS